MDFATSEKLKELNKNLEIFSLNNNIEDYVNTNWEIAKIFSVEEDYIESLRYLSNALKSLEDCPYYYSERTAYILAAIVEGNLKIGKYFVGKEYILQLITLGEIISEKFDFVNYLHFSIEYGLGNLLLARQKLISLINNRSQTNDISYNLFIYSLTSELGIMELERHEFSQASRLIHKSYEWFLELKQETFELSNKEITDFEIISDFRNREIRLLMNLGEMYSLIGNLETAKTYFYKADTVIDKNTAQHRLIYGELLLKLCVLEVELKNKKESTEYLEKSYSNFKSLLSKDDPMWSLFFLHKSSFSAITGDFVSGLDEIKKAIDITENKTYKSNFRLIDMYQKLGRIQTHLGLYEQAYHSLKKSYEIGQINFESDTPKLYLLKFNQGLLLYNMDKETRQNKYNIMNEAIDEAKKNLRPHHKMINWLESMLPQ